MIIYKDRFTGDEMFSDAIKLKIVDDVLIEFDSQKIADKTDMSMVNIGANASAEEAAEEMAEEVRKDYDIVINHSVKAEESKPEKLEFKAYVKRHLKKLYEVILEKKGKEAAEAFKAKASPAMGKILKAYADYDLFTSEHADFNDDSAHCAVLLLNFRDDGITPYFTGLLDDFEEEKV